MQLLEREQAVANVSGMFRITNPSFIGGEGQHQGAMFAKLTNFVYCFDTAQHGVSREAKCARNAFASFVFGEH
jgi:hypothetical protein